MEPTEDIEEVLRVCTYHRSEFDDLLVKTPKSKLQAPFIQNTFDKPDFASLGDLDRLPQELIQIALEELDIVSYVKFRGVNQRARNLASSSRDYTVVVNHGLEGLKALLRVQTAHRFTLSHLYQALINPKCRYCRKFGPFLSLFTCKRACFTCIEISMPLGAIAIPPPKYFCQTVKLSKAQIESVCEPKLRVVSGSHYAVEPWPKVKKPKYVVRCKDAFPKLRALNSKIRVRDMELPPPNQTVMDVEHMYALRYMASTVFPWYDPSRDKLETGKSCAACQFRVEEYEHDSPVPSVPPWGYNDRDRTYTDEEFMEHFRSCSFAKEMWADFKKNDYIRSSQFTRAGGRHPNPFLRYADY
ncbi:uncharacterized protein FIESC28_10234 [Fusarium coffeatum]|uniref:F-box domain-containing protein n=1 Tax=Fusarium coffeatum TaxID=231269 RepID=A0A366QU37_9HYPO|nr:uncharacterized protein FIESC28_10234 [Fusarium coffeatum]RBR08434.1 hypothetical protein FIESC28_10234 [Fusarium coffeatum]